MDPKKFPNLGDPDCLHSVGLYKSGRCVLCGFRVWRPTKWHKQLMSHVRKWMQGRFDHPSGMYGG